MKSRRTLQLIGLVAAALLVAGWCGSLMAAKVRYTFDTWAGPALRVHVSRPVGLAADRPVVFVMHGTNRNASDYRDQWHDLAIEHDFLVVVPEFSDEDFPGAAGYNLGYQYDAAGKPRPRAVWAYSAIEPLFDDIRKRFSLNAGRYALYGHSAGAQFVHRYLLHMPQARVSRIVPANAGWYMMPDYSAAYPYGLGGSTVTPEQLADAMALPVTLMLGEQDIDPQHSNLRRTPEAMAQGAYRLQRGHNFFAAAKALAGRLGVPFNWQLVLVPDVGHDNRLMAPAAVPYLLGLEP